MRAARFYGKEDIRVEQIEEPECKQGQIKIKPAFVGICGTDLHEYIGGPNFAPLTPHPVTKETIPITFGHEFSGTILALGPDVKNFKVGQNVSIQPTIYDGTCYAWLSGWGGGLSDAVVVPANYALPLPDNIPLDIAALVEPLAVGWHAVSRSPLKSDSDVLILGGGPIGIAVIHALKARGCGKIIVSEISGSRQKFCKHFGADIVLDPRHDDVVAKVTEETGGNGVDIVFDCAGIAAGLKAACQSIKARGTVVNVAIWEKEILFQPNELVWKEGHYVACLGYVQQDFKDVIQAIASGAMKPGDMITSKVQLENVVEDGFKELIQNKEKHVKILVQI
ncbi:hypothetical protein G7Y89_g11438 [Cudoniella acicularis]|uniref:Enoyl reductase (ER) domain-containing protein n=1 Tax=Cudoniella acicularis TaxID=354080 RepID=A0A8H4RAU3_9HELO|nr:hypothetical protein G7Y89_g11438 [Cudoniella acicularis]